LNFGENLFLREIKIMQESWHLDSIVSSHSVQPLKNTLLQNMQVEIGINAPLQLTQAKKTCFESSFLSIELTNSILELHV